MKDIPDLESPSCAPEGRRHSVVLGAVLMLVFAFVWVETGGYPEDLMDARKITGPGTFPRLLSAILGMVGLWECWLAFRTGSWRLRFDWGKIVADPGVRNILMVIAMTALFIPLTYYLGFAIGALVYMLSLMARLKAKPVIALICSFLAVVFVVFVFEHVFRVQLPTGILTEPLGWRL